MFYPPTLYDPVPPGADRIVPIPHDNETGKYPVELYGPTGHPKIKS